MPRLGTTVSNDISQAAGRDARRDVFFGTVIDQLHQLGALRLGLSRDRALDILRVVNSLQAYVELTERRGWSGEARQAWVRCVSQGGVILINGFGTRAALPALTRRHIA